MSSRFLETFEIPDRFLPDLVRSLEGTKRNVVVTVNCQLCEILRWKQQNNIFPLQRCYSAYSENPLSKFRDNLSVASLRVR